MAQRQWREYVNEHADSDAYWTRNQVQVEIIIVLAGSWDFGTSCQDGSSLLTIFSYYLPVDNDADQIEEEADDRDERKEQKIDDYFEEIVWMWIGQVSKRPGIARATGLVGVQASGSGHLWI